MDFRKILILVFVSFLLIGAVSAQKNVNDFKVDGSFKSTANGTHISLYLNEKQDSGITIYKLVGNDDDSDDRIDDAYDHLIKDDGDDYLTPDDDYKLNKNSDNTFNFTDSGRAEHGVGEVINVGGERFVVVFWAKNNASSDDGQLMSLLTDFNKNNNVNPVAF